MCTIQDRYQFITASFIGSSGESTRFPRRTNGHPGFPREALRAVAVFLSAALYSTISYLRQFSNAQRDVDPSSQQKHPRPTGIPPPGNPILSIPGTPKHNRGCQCSALLPDTPNEIKMEKIRSQNGSFFPIHLDEIFHHPNPTMKKYLQCILTKQKICQIKGK